MSNNKNSKIVGKNELRYCDVCKYRSEEKRFYWLVVLCMYAFVQISLHMSSSETDSLFT